ncbi:4-hydroxyphenylacetate 3-hydroxylase family protein [Winslowiella toletana]|uniref:4-hydroxyphenylacetate 3-hydroxylase family protein n=1 Tax=Winslowiella toletana TaxID=92490 RepID=UPI0028BEEC27|nr:4-hydroxyphenylacetate 3-hydroxylase N-terminal domain-containing protein [Winslowiella toletana]WNN42659.1 4-hydroxyphenylacetate 3-hydroxylase N-terminal domain-containing protein [Winslowiella toletana]
MPRSGEHYINSLRDGRTVYLNGEKIINHVDHPAFSNAIRSVAKLYDYQASNTELMTFETPCGNRVGRAWQLPTSRQILAERGDAAYAWARQSCGWLGRSPDHVASAITGMITHIKLFDIYSVERADALRRYYEFARDKDLYLTYAIVNPQGDRSKSPGEHTRNQFHTLGVVREMRDGIIVRGAKMLGTAAVLAEEILVAVQNPLKPGVDDKYALSFALPLNTQGIRILARKSYEATSTQLDAPLAHHFDENDAIIFFEDVFVPWERIFVYSNTAMCRQQFHGTAAEILMDTQSQARYAVKLHFLAGLAQRMTQITGINEFPSVRESLANIACHATTVEGLFRSLLHNPIQYGNYFIPNQVLLYACQAFAQTIYPQVIEIIRKLAGGGVIMLPSSVLDFNNPELNYMIEATQYSSVTSAIERVKLMKLVWDAIGSEFGSRHTQYEMFYSGPHFATLARLYGRYDWQNATDMTSTLLASDDMMDFRTP